ncbi:glycosyltransferase [Lacticaseibacillus hegangensis]|uniref:Glycosyltransferase n=1 Tax=Lacticaseibacillus hegangensis TaxID=2486010 RepID=A0ABW4CU95_9LACO|nr:glycosyltransferase [Lacticaseibacillus hegangensis]
MNFFVNALMQKQKSGIEHAELTRLRLFNQHDTPARIVLRNYDPVLHQTLKDDGVDEAQVINMFDYYQQTQATPFNPTKVKDLDFGVLNTTTEFEAEHHRYLVYTPQHQLVARVNVRDDTEEVTSTELFDGFNNLYRVDFYDIRGFVTLQQWYSPDNKIENEVWLTPAGVPVVHAFNRADVNGDISQSGWLLTPVNGQVFSFDTIDELFGHFLNQLNDDFWDDKQPNVFILDRSTIADYTMIHFRKPAYRVLHFHNAQASAQDPMHSIVNNNYEFDLSVMDQFDASITATKRQAKDIEARFHPRTPIFTIAVGVVPERLLNAPRVPVSDREFGKMVVFARVAPEKQLDDLVRALGIVHKDYPQVSLDIYGYADSTNNYEARRKVLEAAKEVGMEDQVQLKGYTTDIDTVENKAMMYGLTSVMEGFNLAIMEASAHGLISFTYDVNYGPNEIVEDKVSGRVTPYKDIPAMAEAIKQVLADKSLAQKYSDGAYDSSKRYAPDAVWREWQALLDEAQKRWPAKLAALPTAAEK